MNKKVLALGILGIFLLSLPITLFISQRKQQTQSKANTATTLSFTPGSSVSTPIQKNVGEPVSIDIMIDPGASQVSFVRFQVSFDSTKLALASSNSFVQNTAAFPSIIEGPITTPNSLAASVSIGGDPTKAITTVTKLGTINLKAIGPTTNDPTQVIFTTLSQALSTGQSDQASQNILSSTSPANIVIHGVADPTVTSGPTGIPSATTTPEPTIATTNLNFKIFLHGVGAAGDNPNPKGASLSNKDPIHPQRNLAVIVYNSNNEEVKNASSSVAYDKDTGDFEGSVDLGPDFTTGNYSVKVQTDRYLWKLVPGIVSIKQLSKNTVPDTSLVAGDTKKDNVLNILDYNILLDCGYGAIEPLPISDPNSVFNSDFCKQHTEFRPNADLNDDGVVNSYDYNLLLRELSVQNGD